MNKINDRLLCFFCSFAMTLIIVPLAWATPPTSITLSYNLNNQTLHVQAEHETTDLDKNYVRLMLVYVNGNQVAEQNYTRQEDYKEFADDVQISAQEGDVIKVDLFCFSGGEMAKEMTVTKE